eukprot:359687-Chlamydomonas_euryale.AAC.3
MDTRHNDIKQLGSIRVVFPRGSAMRITCLDDVIGQTCMPRRRLLFRDECPACIILCLPSSITAIQRNKATQAYTLLVQLLEHSGMPRGSPTVAWMPAADSTSTTAHAASGDALSACRSRNVKTI